MKFAEQKAESIKINNETRKSIFATLIPEYRNQIMKMILIKSH